MNQDFVNKVRSKRDGQNRNAEETRKHLESLSNTASGSTRVVSKLDETNKGLKQVAKSDDIQGVVDSINQLNMTTFLANKDSWTGIVEDLATLADKTQKSLETLEKEGVNKIQKSFTEAIKKLDGTVAQLKKVKVETDSDQKQALRDISEALNGLDMQPVVNVPQPNVTVNEKEVDFTPLITVLDNLDSGINKLAKTQPEFDTSDLQEGIKNVEEAIKKLINKPIPVPNIPSPFANAASQGKQALVDADGHLQIDVLTGGFTSSSSATVTAVADTITSTTLLAANTARKGATVYNDSTAVLYMKFGITASATSFTAKLNQNDYYELPSGYTGRIDGVWASDTAGNALITELS